MGENPEVPVEVVPAPVRLVTKQRAVRVREFDTIVSDRVALAVQANVLIGHFVSKTTLPRVNNSLTEEVELSEEETESYNSALGYLARQFDVGHRDSETVERRVENDTSWEVV